MEEEREESIEDLKVRNQRFIDTTNSFALMENEDDERRETKNIQILEQGKTKYHERFLKIYGGK